MVEGFKYDQPNRSPMSISSSSAAGGGGGASFLGASFFSSFFSTLASGAGPLEAALSTSLTLNLN